MRAEWGDAPRDELPDWLGRVVFVVVVALLLVGDSLGDHVMACATGIDVDEIEEAG